MLTCKEVITEFLSDYLDGLLGPNVVEELERHLEACRPCVAYLNTYKKTRDLVGHAARVEMPEEMKALLQQFLLKHLGLP